jgi:hypothetical protein
MGLRIGDFLSLKREKINQAFANLDGEDILEFQVQTTKEKTIATCHLTRNTYELLRQYWDSVPKSELAFDYSEDALNDKLKSAWIKSFPDRPNELIRFHELRGYTLSTFNDFGLSDNTQKLLTGKKVKGDMATYLQGTNLREQFAKCVSKLILSNNGNNNHTKLETEIKELKRDLEQLREENQKLKEERETVNRGMEKLTIQVKESLQAVRALGAEVEMRTEKLREADRRGMKRLDQFTRLLQDLPTELGVSELVYREALRKRWREIAEEGEEMEAAEKAGGEGEGIG